MYEDRCKESLIDHIETNIQLRQQLAEKDAVIAKLKEALEEFDALIKHQYSGTREAMSDMTYAAQRGVKAIALTNDDSALQEVRKQAQREALLEAAESWQGIDDAVIYANELCRMAKEIK